MIAQIAFGTRARCFHCTGLNSGEGGRIADHGGRDPDQTGLRPVVHNGRKREPEHAIISGESLDQILRVAAFNRITMVIERLSLVSARKFTNGSDAVDLLDGFGFAFLPGNRMSQIDGASDRNEGADRGSGIAAGKAVGSVEDPFQARIERPELRTADYPFAANAEAVSNRQRGFASGRHRCD